MTELNLSIVIRSDGTVPFDADLHPDHKRAMIGHLVETGHTLHHAEDGSHVRITAGPHAPKPA